MRLALDLLKEVVDVWVLVLIHMLWQVIVIVITMIVQVIILRICNGDSGLYQCSDEFRDFEIFGVELILKGFDFVFESVEFQVVLVLDLVDGGFHFIDILGEKFALLVLCEVLSISELL